MSRRCPTSEIVATRRAIAEACRRARERGTREAAAAAIAQLIEATEDEAELCSRLRRRRAR